MVDEVIHSSAHSSTCCDNSTPPEGSIAHPQAIWCIVVMQHLLVFTWMSLVWFSSNTSWWYGAKATPLRLTDRKWLCIFSRSSNRTPVHSSSHAKSKTNTHITSDNMQQVNICVSMCVCVCRRYSHTHSPPCRMCLSSHWSHDWPLIPALQSHCPLNVSHSGCSEPHPLQLHREHTPPGNDGLP